MKKLYTVSFAIALLFQAISQNVGIGTTTPTGPLSFANSLGNKLVLWGDGNSAHYGIGVQSGLLQIYANQSSDNIVFGSGRSGVFSERMRLINSGEEGLILKGRVLLQNGTSNPVDPAYAAGIWLFKPDNSGTMGFMGVQNSQNFGFYGGPNAWGFTYNAINSRVGIGNNNPNAPLAFGAVLGKKITFFPGTLGDAGIGMAGNRLQIYSDNPNADVAIGYDAAGSFNERFAVKPNGALAVNASTGTEGQVLTSNGAGASAQWKSVKNLLPVNFGVGSVYLLNNNPYTLDNATINFTVTQTTRLLIWFATRSFQSCTVGPCHTAWILKAFVDGEEKAAHNIQAVAFPVIQHEDASFGPEMFDVAPGNHTLTLTAQNKLGNPNISIWVYVLQLAN